MTTRRLPGPLRALVALAVGFGLGGVSAMDIQKIPLRLAFAVDGKGSSAETLFEVRENGSYAVNLIFLYDEDAHAPGDRARVWHLVGGSEQEPHTGQWQEVGAPVELDVSLQRLDADAKTDVVREKVSQPHLSSWGEGTLTSRLAVARLAPGRYHLVVRNLSAAPTLRDIRACIGVARAYMGK